MSLDQTDRKILRLLQTDGRMTNQELAINCNISPSACHERFRRLRDDGYILGFSAVLDPNKLEKSLTIFSLVLLNSSINNISDEFTAFTRKVPEITECYMVLGGFDYLLKIQVKDMNAYRLFLGSTLSQMPGVREIRTCAVMDQIKHTTQLPI